MGARMGTEGGLDRSGVAISARAAEDPEPPGCGAAEGDSTGFAAAPAHALVGGAVLVFPVAFSPCVAGLFSGVEPGLLGRFLGFGGRLCSARGLGLA